jgi:hypothetical protein
MVNNDGGFAFGKLNCIDLVLLHVLVAEVFMNI